MATIETFCSVVVLWYIVGYEVRKVHCLHHIVTEKKTSQQITLKAFRVSSQFTYGINTSGSSRRTKREQATQYRNVIIRIGKNTAWPPYLINISSQPHSSIPNRIFDDQLLDLDLGHLFDDPRSSYAAGPSTVSLFTHRVTLIPSSHLGL